MSSSESTPDVKQLLVAEEQTETPRREATGVFARAGARVREGIAKAWRRLRVPEPLPSEPIRAECAKLTLVARQKRDSAVLLLGRGSRAEALQLAREAQSTLERVIGTLRDHEAARGAADGAARELAKAEPFRVPELDADVTAEDVEHLRATLSALDAADRALIPLLRTKREIASVKLSRGLGAVLAVALLTIWIWWERGVHVHVSGAYSSTGAGYHIYDGDPETEWWSPDHESGWIDLTFPTRKIYVIKLLNSHNRQFMDRATHEFEVSMWRRGERVWVADGAFAHATTEKEWKVFDTFGVKCDRIRIDIKSHHGNGAGLAEIELE
jgi:hypothetical protein